jgi:RNA polymerase sigma-70 factor (ECF subfamily)
MRITGESWKRVASIGRRARILLMVERMPDAAVIGKAAAREQRGRGTPATEAFAEAVESNRSLVFSVAYHMLHNVALAEEVSQEVFLRLFRDFARIEDRSHLVHWLRRTTVHRCLDSLRRTAGHHPVPLDEVDLPAPQPAEADPFVGRTLRRLVASLPPAARAVIVLRYQEDLEPRQIAEVLDLPVNTVKSRLRRALAVLRGRRAEMEESNHGPARD